MSTTLFIVIAVVLVLVVMGIFAIIAKPSKGSRTGRRFKAHPLMTNAEAKFYDQMHEAVPEFLIHPQVGMEAVVRAISLKDRGFLNRRLDFVITTQTHEIVAVVELDDSTHDRKAAQEKDKRRDDILAEAGHPVHRWRLKDRMSASEIRAALLPSKPVELAVRKPA